MDNRVVEITEFKLRPECSDDAFLRTVEPVNQAARKLKGFISRRLLRSGEGWIEVFEWDDIESARSAGEVWASLPGLESYCSMVDHGSLKFRCHPLKGTA